MPVEARRDAHRLIYIGSLATVDDRTVTIAKVVMDTCDSCA